MQAVLLAAGHGGELGYLGFGNVLLSETLPCPGGGKAIFRGLAYAWVPGTCRLDHRFDIGQQRLTELRKARRLDHAIRGWARAGDQGSRGHGVDAGPTALGGKIGGRAMRFMGMLSGRLERAEAHLGAVVCAQAFCDEAWQQDFGLSQLFDDTRLHRVLGLGRKSKLPCQDESDLAPDQSSICHIAAEITANGRALSGLLR
jgi:hypothetical protein